VIEGRKIRLRAVEEKDLEFLLKMANDPEISGLVVGWEFSLSLTDQKMWFSQSQTDRSNRRFIVEDGNAHPIGLTGLWAIDWHDRHALTALKLSSKETRGKGYGTDAIMTIMAYAFYEVGLRKLWGEILPYNIASYKAYVGKCGWRVEGLLRKHVFRKGSFHDLYRVSILKEEFDLLPKAAEYVDLINPVDITQALQPEDKDRV